MTGKVYKVTEDELRSIVSKGVIDGLNAVGIYAHDKNSEIERRRDFEFLHDVRVSSESAKAKVATGFIMLALVGVAAWLVTGFKFWART